ncbi:MAG: hypothetical protein IPJ11_07895 [Gemmatimonadetes bacterium]|nr:hypothetical protein [Gemmatimonadota bacterium]
MSRFGGWRTVPSEDGGGGDSLNGMDAWEATPVAEAVVRLPLQVSTDHRAMRPSAPAAAPRVSGATRPPAVARGVTA